MAVVACRESTSMNNKLEIYDSRDTRGRKHKSTVKLGIRRVKGP